MCTFLAALALLLSSPASASEWLGRDLEGHAIVVGGTPRAIVFWSMHDAGLAATVDLIGRAGLELVLVNTDSANEHARIRSYLLQEGVSGVVTTDYDGALARRFAAPEGATVVVLDGSGAVASRLSAGWDLAERLASVEVVRAVGQR
jgi:hypothetical protein